METRHAATVTAPETVKRIRMAPKEIHTSPRAREVNVLARDARSGNIRTSSVQEFPEAGEVATHLLIPNLHRPTDVGVAGRV